MFEDKIQERYEVNRSALEDAIRQVHLVMGGDISDSDKSDSMFAILVIMDYFHLDKSLVGTELDVLSLDSVEQFFRRRGLFCHQTELKGKWWRDACGPMLTTDKQGNVVALLPGVFGYKRLNPSTGRKIRVSKKTTRDLDTRSLNFFRYLSRGHLTLKDFMRYSISAVPVRNFIVIAVVGLISTLLTMLVPFANKQMFSEVIPSGIMRGILPICALLLGAGISSVLFTMIQNLVIARVRDKFNANLQSAVMARVMTLPSSLFRKYAPGDLSARILSVNNVYQLLSAQMLSALAAGIFSSMFILAAFVYAKSMIWVVSLILLSHVLLSIALIKNYGKEYTEKVSRGVHTQEFEYGVLSGIHKIKNNRAEVRAYSQWMSRYSKSENITASTPWILKYGQSVIASAIFCVGDLITWIVAWKSSMSISDFIAFMSVFGIMQKSLNTMTGEWQRIAQIKPFLKLLEPILNSEPEFRDGQPYVSSISGNIEVDHVSFSYESNPTKILDDVSLHIHAGENVGLVGASGCGKSTLMRLMLGFERPDSGAVFYGQYNVSDVNMGSLRRFVGFCPQNIQIFPGTIAENICLGSENCTMDDIWEAARIAAIDEDIRKMPLQMDTLLGEGGSGLSGGQCQRILIARAIIDKPKVMFFDEATSALDNITQRKVVENLDAIGCTRVSIAHRLSTVMSCSRIIVLDKGHIVEDGTPQELLDRKGFFYKLSIRQQ